MDKREVDFFIDRLAKTLNYFLNEVLKMFLMSILIQFA